MKVSLFIDYPWYFILFCLLAGVLAAWLTYRKNVFNEPEKPFAWPVWLMAILRTLTVSILAFLLLSPVLKNLIKHKEQPIIILAADNSQSVLLNKDSAYYKTKYLEDLKSLKEQLSEKFDVRSFTFGGQTNNAFQLDFDQKQTDISQLYNTIYETFYNQNIGAVITLTDGIYNQGENPLYVSEKFNAPFYMVALGDTTPANDLLIKHVQYNKIAYSGNLLPMQIHVQSKGYKGKKTTLKITHSGKTIFSQDILIDNDRFYKGIDVKIPAIGEGLQRYHIELSRQENEISYINNATDVFIDILDNKRKILIVSLAPNPDISALKNSIERNSTFEVESYLYDDFMKINGANSKKLQNYQLVILHQLPGAGQSASSLISAINEAKVSVWYILGTMSSTPAFNNLDIGLQIQQSGGRSNEVSGILNKSFGLFSLPPELEMVLSKMPPLYAPFGEYRVSDRQNILLYQKIGKVSTNIPLLLFSNKGKTKTAVLSGEGIWRWFLSNYQLQGNFKDMDALVEKTVQYLSLKSDNRLFRMRPAKNLFYEDEHVIFDAEVYNESYEPLKDATIDMRIKNEAGKEFNFTFQPNGVNWHLDAGMLAAGTYSYKASTKISGKDYSLTGEFMVKKMELEFLETVANHNLLNSIAVQQGGKMVYPSQMSEIAELIKDRDDILPISYLQAELKDLINFKWLFGLILLFLSVEWFMRKYFGSY